MRKSNESSERNDTSSLKHNGPTPGPWQLATNDPTLVVTTALDNEGNCKVVADVLHELGPAGPSAIGNARLIAAAPDMLAALSRLIGLKNNPQFKCAEVTAMAWGDARAAVDAAVGDPAHVSKPAEVA